MKALNLKLPVMLAVLCISAFAVAGDCDFSKCTTSAGNCDPSMCPPGCCTVEECMSVCGAGVGWEQSQWQDVRYDQNGHVQKAMSARLAKNIARQYLEKYSIDGRVKLAASDNDTYTFEIVRASNEYVKMLEINRKNGWVRQLDGC